MVQNKNKKILFLTNNDNTLPLYSRLQESGFEVLLHKQPLTLQEVQNNKPNLIISYNYEHIVKNDVLESNTNIINLHISFLPWNKGSNPNVWSFLDNTPKGVTIHRMTEKIDEGDILLQKEVSFDENVETLRTTYNKLHDEIQKLLIDNINQLIENKICAKKQQGAGSLHKQKELDDLCKTFSISYDEKISELIKRYKVYKRNF